MPAPASQASRTRQHRAYSGATDAPGGQSARTYQGTASARAAIWGPAFQVSKDQSMLSKL